MACLHWPPQALWAPGGFAAALTPQEISLVRISVTALVDHRAIVQPEALSQLKKKSNDPSGNEPVTIQLLAQNPNQPRH